MDDSLRPLPKLRPLEAQWIERNGEPALMLQDRLAIGARAIVVPRLLAPLLALCDGTRSVAGLQAAMELHTGVRLDLALVGRVVAQLDEALMLDNQSYARAYQRTLEEFRSAPFRPAALAGGGYPAEPSELRALLEDHLARAAAARNGRGSDGREPDGRERGHPAGAAEGSRERGHPAGAGDTRAGETPALPAELLPAELLPAELLPAELLPAELFPAELLPAQGPIRGLICPHIDYERGGAVYAGVWERAREAVEGADLAILLGTDHAGGPAELTLTRQGYDTPLGTLETDVEAVDLVAAAVGEEAAFRSELNHRPEHSIELAAVWLRHLAGSRPIRILPVLCGSFQPFTHGGARPTEVERWQAGVLALRQVARRERTLVVAAADLAHVGPAFGDARPVSPADRSALAAADAEMLAAVARGDAEGFLDLLAREGDRHRVCGLPPIYLALQVLGPVRGEQVDYAQCSAPGGSVVSVAGILLL